MSVEEDTELRDIVLETLEQRGVVGRTKVCKLELLSHSWSSINQTFIRSMSYRTVTMPKCSTNLISVLGHAKSSYIYSLRRDSCSPGLQLVMSWLFASCICVALFRLMQDKISILNKRMQESLDTDEGRLCLNAENPCVLALADVILILLQGGWWLL